MDSICLSISRRVSNARTMTHREPAVSIAPRPAMPSTDHQYLGGRDFTGSSDLAGEEATKLLSNFDHGAIAAYVGHGGEGIQGLGTGEPWRHVNGPHIDVALGQLLEPLRVLGRPD